MPRARILTGVVAVCAVLALPAGASASVATIDITGSGVFPVPGGVDVLVDTVTMTYIAGEGETNRLSVVRDGVGWMLTDPGAVIFAPQCSVTADGHNAFCRRPTTFNRLRERLGVNARDGDDEISVAWPGAQDTSLFASGSTLEGGEGDDQIFGGDMGDDIHGGAGNDGLSGQNGNDQITGGAGRDVMNGGANDDVLEARDDEADLVECGVGRDRVSVDVLDRVSGCESDGTVPATPDPAPGAPAAVPDRTAPATHVSLPGRPRRIATLVRAGLLVTVRTSEASTIRATLHRGSAKGASAGRASAKRETSGRVRMRLRLTSSARRRLSSQDSARLTLRVTATDRAGNRRTVDRRFTVRG